MNEVELVFRKKDDSDVKLTMTGYTQEFIDQMKIRYNAMDYECVKETYRKLHRKIDGFYWFWIGIVGAEMVNLFIEEITLK